VIKDLNFKGPVVSRLNDFVSLMVRSFMASSIRPLLISHLTILDKYNTI